MKYFRSGKSEGCYSFVLFDCINKANSFVNYLDSLGLNMRSRIYKRDECREWFRENNTQTQGYYLVYGRAVPTEIVKSFFDLMEDK